MGSEYKKYVSTTGGKVTFMLSHNGYTYSKRKTVKGADYYYCDFRKAQELGLQTRYQSDKEFARYIKMFSCLAFVPVRDVKRRFAQVVQIIPEALLPLACYMEDTYVGNNFVAPLFDIEFWNVSDRVNNGIPKTSNFVEGFHNRLNKMMKPKRPPMWRFLATLRKIQRKTETTIAKLNAPGSLPRLQRKKYRSLNHKLQELCAAYNYRHGAGRFKKWILQLTLCTPNFKN